MPPQTKSAKPAPSADALAQFEERRLPLDVPEFKTAEIRYRLLEPDDPQAGRRYPLVVFLHGAGERGDDNRSQLMYLPEVLAAAEQRRRYPCFAVAPQCPDDMRWVEVAWGEKDSRPQGPPSPAMRMAEAILDAVMKDPRVDAARIYLTGLSMGGYGCWDWALRRPERFAAIAPLCGGGDESLAPRLKDVPVWAVHGDQDAAVPVVRSRRMIEALEKAGGSPKYSELKGVGHNCWTTAYAPKFGLLEWLFSQRREP